MVGGYKDVALSISSEYPTNELTVRTPLLLPPAYPGASYQLNLEVVGGVAPYRWFRAYGSLPPGLNLSESGVISGTVAETVGGYNFTLMVADAKSRTVFAGFHIDYTYALPVITVNFPCPTVTPVGVGYSCALSASGGTAPYVWAFATGSLPPGITLSSTGLISGTPLSPGTFPFQVRVRDLGRFESTRNLSLDVTFRAGMAPNWLWDIVGKPRSGSSR
jgi:hypothetical protein